MVVGGGVITHKEMQVGLHNGVTSKSVRIARYFSKTGGCNLFLSLLDVHALVAPQFNGKRSEWLQNKNAKLVWSHAEDGSTIFDIAEECSSEIRNT